MEQPLNNFFAVSAQRSSLKRDPYELLHGIYHQLVTDSDLDSVSRPDAYKSLASQIKETLLGQPLYSIQEPYNSVIVGRKPQPCKGRCYVTHNSDMRCMDPTTNESGLCDGCSKKKQRISK